MEKIKNSVRIWQQLRCIIKEKWQIYDGGQTLGNSCNWNIEDYTNNINPKFMKDIFEPKSNVKIKPFDVVFNARKTSEFFNFTNSSLSKNMESLKKWNFFLKI